MSWIKTKPTIDPANATADIHGRVRTEAGGTPHGLFGRQSVLPTHGAIRRCGVGKSIRIVLLELLPRALDAGQRADGCGGK
jgi:hypothetical protein